MAPARADRAAPDVEPELLGHAPRRDVLRPDQRDRATVASRSSNAPRGRLPGFGGDALTLACRQDVPARARCTARRRRPAQVGPQSPISSPVCLVLDREEPGSFSLVPLELSLRSSGASPRGRTAPGTTASRRHRPARPPWNASTSDRSAANGRRRKSLGLDGGRARSSMRRQRRILGAPPPARVSSGVRGILPVSPAPTNARHGRRFDMADRPDRADDPPDHGRAAGTTAGTL